MTNFKATKKALLSSIVALVICFTMFLGTTFAWFTDSVTSSNNIIQSGTLNIGMYWMEGDEDPATADWEDASTGAIFNYTKWEPGYVEAKHIKIANEGTLALKYKLLIVPNGEVEALADVIDVYYIEGATQLTRDMLATATPVGTLRDMIEDTDGAAHGALLPVGEKATDTYERVGEVTATIAFKMQESAGNEYQGMTIGTDFSIQLFATQYTYEGDSFDNQYDNDALLPTLVSTESNLNTILNGGYAMLTSDLQSSAILTLTNGILDGNGNEISTENTTGIVDATGGTIQNVGLEGIETKKQVGRIEKVFIPKIGITSTDGLTQNLVIDEVTVENTPRAISLDANNNSVYASNSTFANVVYIYKQEIAVFENCTFTTDEQANENDAAWIGLGGDMTFINCHFEESVDFYVNNPDYTGTITFINCTYGNNGVEKRPIEASVDFFTYWMEYSLALYDGTFGEGDPGRTNFTCIVNDTVVWEATNN